MLKAPFPAMTWSDDSIEHIARHGVMPGEVEDVMYGRPRLVAQGREDTAEVYGQTVAGRYLIVIVNEAMDGGAYVVTARDMTDSERRTFRQKGR